MFLRPPPPARAHLRAQAGDFGTRGLSASLAGRRRDWDGLALVDYSGSDNDFRFLDDNGTPAGELQTLELRARQSIIGPMQEWLRSYYHNRQGRYAAVDAVDFPDEKNDPYYVQISNELTAINDEASPVVKMVNKLIVDAVQGGVSDIHIEPFEKRVVVRYRKDGRMTEVMQLPKRMQNNISSRIKIMSKLDIAEKRLPQDGRIRLKMKYQGKVKDLDFRVSTLPTLHGEKIDRKSVV